MVTEREIKEAEKRLKTAIENGEVGRIGNPRNCPKCGGKMWPVGSIYYFVCMKCGYEEDSFYS